MIYIYTYHIFSLTREEKLCLRDDLFFLLQRTVFSLLHWWLDVLSMQQLQSSSSWSLSKKVLCYVYCILLIMNKNVLKCLCVTVFLFQGTCFICLVLNVLYYTMCNMYYVLNTHTYNHNHISLTFFQGKQH